jgi:hypothetical protein
MPDLTVDEIKRLMELEVKATPGPWRELGRETGWGIECQSGYFVVEWGHGLFDADAALIAESRNRLKELCALALEALAARDRERVAREALTFYAAPISYGPAGYVDLAYAIAVDRGSRARAAIRTLQGESK